MVALFNNRVSLPQTGECGLMEGLTQMLLGLHLISSAPLQLLLYCLLCYNLEQELGECIPPPILKFLAPPNRKSMGQSGLLIIFCIKTMKCMKLKTERDLSYMDPLTVKCFQSNGTSSISVILLTNGRKGGQTVANLKPPWRR